MIPKIGGCMILKNPPLRWVHDLRKSQKNEEPLTGVPLHSLATKTGGNGKADRYPLSQRMICAIVSSPGHPRPAGPRI